MLKFENLQIQSFSSVHYFGHSCESFGKIDKLTDLFEVTNLHNHSVESHNKEKIILCNQIKRKAETSTCELREIFNECCRDSIGASSVTFKKLKAVCFREGGKFNRDYPHAHKNLEYCYLNQAILLII